MTDERAVVPLPGAGLPPELLEALARGVAAAFAPPQPPARGGGGAGFPDRRAVRGPAGGLPGDGPSAGDRRRAAVHGGVPGERKTTRRYPRRFADDFAASGQDVTDLAEFAARWRARMMTAAARGSAGRAAPGGQRDDRPRRRLRPTGRPRVRRSRS